MGRAIDLSGRRFKKLLVLHRVSGIVGHRQGAVWLCKCDCGAFTEVNTGRLRSGNTGSCGCVKRSVLGISTTEHGRTGTRTYRIWKAMRTRCLNQNTLQYKDYGGRGIKVCKRWHKFENFLADMGEAPDGCSIDRIDNDGDYKPSNCRWATRQEQNRNARSNVNLTLHGTTLTAAEWGRLFHISKSTVYARIRRGWSLEDACTRPPRPLRGKVLHLSED